MPVFVSVGHRGRGVCTGADTSFIRFGVQMTRFCPAERWLRVRMRTKLGHLVPLSPEKGVPVFACEQNLGLLETSERACVFACEQDLGEPEAPERCSRVRMRTKPRVAGSSRKVLACSHANKTSGCRKLEKGARVFACEQDFGEPEAQERCSRVRMRTRPRGAGSSRKAVACSHANKTSGSRKLKKGVRVFACEQDLGELEARERRLRVRMRTNLGSRKLEKGARVFACEQNLGLLEASERACVFACEQEPWLAFLSKWNFFLTASTIFMVGAVGADTSSFLAPSVSDPRFGFHPAWSHQSSLQAFSLSCSGCPVAAVVPVSGSRSSTVSILRSSVVSGCRFFLVSVCRTLD